MPHPSLLKPILVGTSLVIGASVALYETNPHIRNLVDSAALKLGHIFEDILSAIDDSIRNLSPEQREERRRQQRQRVGMVAMEMGPRSGPPGSRSADHGTTSLQIARRGSRGGSVKIKKEEDEEQAWTADSSGRQQDLRAKRRRLWELAEAAPVYTATAGAALPPPYAQNDSAVDVARAGSPVAEADQVVSKGSERELPSDADKDTPQQPIEIETQLGQQATQQTPEILDQTSNDSYQHILFQQHISEDINNNEAEEEEDDNASSSASHSLIATPQHSPTPSSPAPEDLVDALSSTDDDGASSTGTETMSHVSGYSLGGEMAAGSEAGWSSDAGDVISIADSSEDEAWELARMQEEMAR